MIYTIYRTLPSSPGKQGGLNISVLYRVGGIGKTQLTAQFAKSCKDRFSAVFCINGKTESTLRAGLAGLIDRIPSVAALRKDEFSGHEESIEMTIKSCYSMVVTYSDQVSW